MFPWFVQLEILYACTLNLDKSPDGKSDLSRDRFKSYDCICLFIQNDNNMQNIREQKMILINEQTNNKLYTKNI